MPANPKYLSKRSQRIGKISAAILGGFLVTTAVHMAIGVLLVDRTPVVMATIWTSWLLWVALMLIAFSAHKAWKVWLSYILIILVCTVIIILNK